MSHKKLILLAAAASFGCGPGDISGPADPMAAFSVVAAPVVPDGAFSFLPPLAPAADLGGEFDPSLTPVVRIAGSGFMLELPATLNDDEDLYQADWKTDDPALVEGATYQLSVHVGRWELGVALIGTWGRTSKRKTVPDGVHAVRLGQNLPIKFWVGEGAIPQETSGIGGTVTVDGQAIPGILVALAGPEIAETTTDQQGEFGFSSLLAGQYTVSISGWGDEYEFAEPSQQVEVAEGETGIVSFMGSRASPWQRMDIPGGTKGLFAVWGTGPNDVFAVGDRVALHFDGSVWETQDVPENAYELKAVWGSGSDDVWSVSYGGILHFDGTSWSWVAAIENQNFWGIWGSSPNEIYAVGMGGGIYRYNGSDWVSESFEADVWLKSVHGFGSLAFAVGGPEPGGDFGYILRRNGSTWEPMDSNPFWSPNSVYGVSETLAFALEGGLAQFDGTSWQHVPASLPEGFGGQALWARSATDVILGGQIFLPVGTGVPTVLFWDGLSSTDVTPDGMPLNAPVQGVWGTPDGATVFIVGSEADAQGNNNLGYIYRWKRW